MDIQAQFQARIEAMRRNYLETLRERADRLRPIAVAMRTGGATGDMITSARFDIHKIAGTARTFSYPDLSALAVRAEAAIDTGAYGSGSELADFLAELERVLEVAPRVNRSAAKST